MMSSHQPSAAAHPASDPHQPQGQPAGGSGGELPREEAPQSAAPSSAMAMRNLNSAAALPVHSYLEHQHQHFPPHPHPPTRLFHTATDSHISDITQTSPQQQYYPASAFSFSSSSALPYFQVQQQQQSHGPVVAAATATAATATAPNNHRLDATMSLNQENNSATGGGESTTAQPSTTTTQPMSNGSNNTASTTSTTGPTQIQTQVRAGGAPARAYMNEKIVPYLLEGMKAVARDQPPNPLRVLGEFLIQKSNEVEGDAAGARKSPD